MRLTHSILQWTNAIRYFGIWFRTDQLSRKIQQAILHTRIKGLVKIGSLQFS